MNTATSWKEIWNNLDISSKKTELRQPFGSDAFKKAEVHQHIGNVFNLAIYCLRGTLLHSSMNVLGFDPTDNLYDLASI